MKCSEGYELNGNNQCNPICANYQFFNATKDRFKCVDCDKSCETCNPITGQCVTCKAPTGIDRQSGKGTQPNNKGSCDMVACDGENADEEYPKCRECRWDPFIESMTCTLCTNDGVDNKYRLLSDGTCKKTDCTQNSFFTGFNEEK